MTPPTKPGAVLSVDYVERILETARRRGELFPPLSELLDSHEELRRQLSRAVEALRRVKLMMEGEGWDAPEDVWEVAHDALAEHDKDQSTSGAQVAGVGGAAETGASAGSEARGDAGPNSPDPVQVRAPEPPLVEQSKPGAEAARCPRCRGDGYSSCRCEPAPPKTEVDYSGDIYPSSQPTRAELVAALRELVDALHCRQSHIGYACNTYEVSYAESSDDPIKQARALLVSIDKEAGR